MSEAATSNFLIQSGTSFIVEFKEATIISSMLMRHNHFSQTDHDIIMSSRQAIFAFLVTLLLNFVQVKYQGKDQSPFETHPEPIFIAILSLLVYCWSCDAKLKLSAVNNRILSSSIYACFVHLSMAFFGPLSLGSISSILFPESLCPLLFSLSIFYSVCQLPKSQVKAIWKWIQSAIRPIMDKFTPDQQHQQGRTRRGPVSVELPWFSHAFMDQVDIHPPV